MSPEDLEESEKRIAAYRDKVTAAVSEFDQAAATCDGLARPDIAGLASAKAAAEEEVRTVAGELGALAAQIEAVGQTISAVEGYRKQREEQERQYGIVGNLANLASGNNPKRITLQRFVLASLFEEVAIAASARLSRMSRGRYRVDAARIRIVRVWRSERLLTVPEGSE